MNIEQLNDQVLNQAICDYVRHVVINSSTQRDLAHRRGIAASLIPNGLDYKQPPCINMWRSHGFTMPSGYDGKIESCCSRPAR